MDLSQLEAAAKTIEQVSKNWAELAIPNVASSAAAGLQNGAATLTDFAKPAIDRVAQLLEKDPNTITVNDPYVQKVFEG